MCLSVLRLPSSPPCFNGDFKPPGRRARVFDEFSDYLYMDLLSELIVSAVAFGRTAMGIITRPYETYRRIVTHGKPGELVFIAALLGIYFALASVVKVAAFRPFLLTQQFIVLFMGAISGALVSTVSIMAAGRLFRVRVRFTRLLIAWSYTLIPTTVWFLATSFLYVLLPPPRTTSVFGIVFSLLFLAFSATLLWWKVTLSYLVLRFTLKLNLGQSLVVAGVCAPVVATWAVIMYKTGIFKVPFL